MKKEIEDLKNKYENIPLKISSNEAVNVPPSKPSISLNISSTESVNVPPSKPYVPHKISSIESVNVLPSNAYVPRNISPTEHVPFAKPPSKIDYRSQKVNPISQV